MQALFLWAIVRFRKRLFSRLMQECPCMFISERAAEALEIALITTEAFDA